MNKKGQNLLGKAIIFVALFFMGGIISVFALPSFTGRFFICGLIFAAVGIGVTSVAFHLGGR